MLKVEFIRPNTIAVYLSKEFSSYGEAEDYIERAVERLADKGYEITELNGSNSRNGTIECVHDFEADTLLISWGTL